ncbi:unnamed protein product, partial [Dibothriocephalus latus]
MPMTTDFLIEFLVRFLADYLGPPHLQYVDEESPPGSTLTLSQSPSLMTEADTSGTRGGSFSSDTDIPSMWSSSAAEPGFTHISAITSITSTTSDNFTSSNKRDTWGPADRDAAIHDASSISISSITDLSSSQNSTTNHPTADFSEDEEYEEYQEEEMEEEEEQEKEKEHPTTGFSDDEEYEEDQEEEREKNDE